MPRGADGRPIDGNAVVLAILENLVDQKFGWNGWSAARSDQALIPSQ